MLARSRVAKGLVLKAGSARFLGAAAPAGDWIISPAAGTLLASNPSIDVKSLAAKCAALSPGKGRVVITKVCVCVCVCEFVCLHVCVFVCLCVGVFVCVCVCV